MHEEFSSSDELHDEEYLLVCLEHVLHSHQERMIGFQQNLLLQQSRVQLVMLQDNVFSQRLHGIDFAILNLLNQKYLSKAPLSNNFLDLEVFKIDLLVFLLHEESIRPHNLHFLVELGNLVD